MAPHEKKDEIVVAHFDVNGETVATFGKAWDYAHTLPLPVYVKFQGFKRAK